MYGDGESFLFVGVVILGVVVTMFFSLFNMDSTEHESRNYITLEDSEGWDIVE